MAQDRYFTNFPLIEYNSKPAIDITKRVVMLNYVLKNPYLFYPYEIKSNERADQFSNIYYEDQYKSWLLYLSNNMVDPYYEWHLDLDEMKNFIIKKYGSTELALNKIKHYICNWENQDNISISRYDSLLPTLKKYWIPDYQNSNKIMSYKRKQIDQIMNTNSIRTYSVANTSFIKDEIVDIVFDTNNTGQGQILSTTDSKIYVQHTSGVTLENETVNIEENSYIYGQESTVNTVFTTATNIVDNLLPEEQVYWTPMTYYEYENAKNAYNKTLKILDKAYSKQVADNLKEVLK
mgnify:FL=1|jgi:hypothetical protein